ncbi:MAG: VCBS repeat-containing protein, partial [Chloroflexi bacterium]|nr:VCBS repeat-containing protein [Chloroflexota bacterium]
MQAVSARIALRVAALAACCSAIALLSAGCVDDIPEQSAGEVRVVEPTAALFMEDTEPAGLTYVQHEKNEPGTCLFDNMTRETEDERSGTLCDAERMTGGAAAGDFDGDGATDLLVTRLDGHDLLFRNRGDGTFEEVSAEAGLERWNLATNGAVWGDVDNDGDLDLFVTTVGDTRHYLFINDGGVFT